MQSVYKIQDGETIFDIAMTTYGSLELVYQIIKDNPHLENINTDLTAINERQLIIDDSIIPSEVQGEKRIQLPVENTGYKIIEGQSIFDVALMVYGDVEKVLQLIRDNKTIESINQNMITGITVTYDTILNENLIFTNYLKKNNLIVNTSSTKENPGSGFSLGFKTESFF